MEPKQKLQEIGSNTSCPVAVIVREGKILTGLRHYTKEISVWTLPGGRCDQGETLEKTLLREVAEEVGITDLNVQKYAGEVPGAKEGDKVHIFICNSSQEAELKEPEKFSEWKWLHLEEIPENFINSKVLELIGGHVLLGGDRAV
ncbi:MAG: NUDIX domain-containing protein [Candidatus Paceibacterota bacterium]